MSKQFRVLWHERRNELIPVWDFKPAWKQVLFTWSFISAAFQNDPIFWWTCVGISFRVVFTWNFYHPKWNFISVKVTDMKFISALSFKRTCALNGTSNESAVIHFVSGKLCSRENLMPVWNFISVKMTDMNLYRFEFHFASFNVNTSKELDWTPKWDFQPKWNLIPVWVHFVSHVNVLLI